MVEIGKLIARVEIPELFLTKNNILFISFHPRFLPEHCSLIPFSFHLYSACKMIKLNNNFTCSNKTI